MSEDTLPAETTITEVIVLDYDKAVERMRQEQTPSVYGEPQWWEDYPGITKDEAERHARMRQAPTDISASALQQATQSGDKELVAMILAARKHRREEIAARLDEVNRAAMEDPIKISGASQEAREAIIFGAMYAEPVSIPEPSGAEMIRTLSNRVHTANQKWWVSLRTGRKLVRNVGEMLMLVTSELAEAMEGHRKDKMDDHLPHRKMIEVELADALIRILDMAAGMGLDLGGAFEEKMAYNATRKDHQREARLGKHGKKY